jgi:hypothetical protein
MPGVHPRLRLDARVVQVAGEAGAEGVEVVPARRQARAQFAGLHQRVDLHQRLVGVARAEAGDDRVDLPVERRAVEQHHGGVLAGFLGVARVGEDLRAVHRRVPQLADVGEHQHVGVHVDGVPAVLAECGDREAREAELRVRRQPRVVRHRRQRVVDLPHLDRARRVAAHRMLEHAPGQPLAAVGATEDANRIGMHGLKRRGGRRSDSRSAITPPLPLAGEGKG